AARRTLTISTRASLTPRFSRRLSFRLHRLYDDHTARVQLVVAGQKLFPYPPLRARELLGQRLHPPHPHVTEMFAESLLVPGRPPPVEIIARVQPPPPSALGVAQHLERILEQVIAQIDLVDVDTARPR